MFGISVKNGTGAGRLRIVAERWECECPHPIWAEQLRDHPDHIDECPDCGARREANVTRTDG